MRKMRKFAPTRKPVALETLIQTHTYSINKSHNPGQGSEMCTLDNWLYVLTNFQQQKILSFSNCFSTSSL